MNKLSKIALITCSNSSVDYFEEFKDVYVLRSDINFSNGDTFADYTEIDAKTFYEHLIKNKNEDVPKTSYMTYGRMVELFTKLKNDGYTEGLAIVISSNLSGLYSASQQAAKEAGFNLTVYDSKTVAYAQFYMVKVAKEMIEDGKSVEEIVLTLNQVRDNNKVNFAVETLLYLVKNGRLSKLSGLFGTLLKIKPVLTIDAEGKVVNIEKIKTFKKALNVIIDMYFEETENKHCITHISHAHNDAAVEYIKMRIKEKYPNREIETTYLSPVVGAHAGPGAVGLGYILIN